MDNECVILKMPEYVYTVCEVLRVIDGDTIVISIPVEMDIGFNVTVKAETKQTVRLYGINAYETSLRGDTTQEEKEKGLEAKQFLIDLIEGKYVKAETIKEKGKYGRYVAKIYFEDKEINSLMVEKGYAIYKDY